MMENDKFNDIIRRKLKSVQTDFQEEDWDKMHAKLLAYHPPSFWGRYGNLIKYGTGGLVLTGLVSTIIYLTNENKTLQDNLNTIKIDTVQNVQYITKTDTVYITKTAYKTVPKVVEHIKYVYVEKPEELDNEVVNSELINSNAELKETEKNFGPSNEVKNVNGNPKNDFVKVANTNQRNLTQNSSTGQREMPANVVSPKTNVESRFEPNNESKPTYNTNSGFEKRIASNTNTEMPNSSKLPVSTSVENIQNRVFENLIVKDLVNVGLDNRLVGVKDKFSDRQIRYFRSNRAVNHQKFAVKKPSFQIPDFQYQAGLGVLQSFDGRGGEVWNEVGFGRHWALNFGLGYYKLNGANYFTEDNFKKDNKQDFRNLHGGSVPNNAEILNIRITSKLLSMPLAIYYKWPINRTFTLLYSLGTNLNLKSTQNFDFISRNDNKEFKEEHKEFVAKNSILNDMYFSTGLQANYRRYTLRVEPYFNLKFKPNSDMPSEINKSPFGVRVRAGFKIKK